MNILETVSKNQISFKKAYWLVYIGIIVVFVWTIIFPTTIRYWSQLGRLAATVSIVSFWLALMPGILKRFKSKGPLTSIRVLLMLFRRQSGILMYVAAFVHYFWSRVLPILAASGDLLSISVFEGFGFFAFVLATPLWLTSNDFSQFGPLKKFWKPIQSLVYIIVWFLVFHIGLQEWGIRAVITLLIAILETTSLVLS